MSLQNKNHLVILQCQSSNRRGPLSRRGKFTDWKFRENLQTENLEKIYKTIYIEHRRKTKVNYPTSSSREPGLRNHEIIDHDDNKAMEARSLSLVCRNFNNSVPAKWRRPSWSPWIEDTSRIDMTWNGDADRVVAMWNAGAWDLWVQTRNGDASILGFCNVNRAFAVTWNESRQLWPLRETCKLFFTKYSNSLRSCCFFHLNFSETLTFRRL